jgi:hypothetical protein
MKFTSRQIALLIATIVVAGLALPALAAAQDYLTLSATAAQLRTQSTQAYWTPERLASAKPMPLPLAPSTAASTSRTGSVGPSVGGDGKPGIVHATPDLRHLLFAPSLNPALEEGVAEPQMRGTSGAPFTSSRAVFGGLSAAERTYPNRINGKLFFTQPGVGNFVCSATVQRPGIITTAGHCVHRGSGGAAGFFTNFLFVPAFRNGAAPFNSWPWTFVVVTGTWATGGGVVPNAADYAIIELRPTLCSGAVRFIGNCIGFAGFQTGPFLTTEHITSMGYPCNIDSCNIMHRVDAEPHRNFAPNNTTIGSDMRGGSSGGGWYQNYGEYGAGQPGTATNTGINRLRGVTSFGFVSFSPKEQGASIFDNRFIQILNIACANRAGNC